MGSKTPQTWPFSPTTLQSWAEDEIEECIAMIELKQDCLRRDNYQCVLSHHFDRNSIRQGKIPLDKSELPTFEESTNTEAAHILPFGLRKFDEHNMQQVRYDLATSRFESITQLYGNNRSRLKLPSGGQYTNIFQSSKTRLARIR